MSKRCLIALLLVAILPTGCVYYNTFYHARAAAREAEILREARAPDTPPGPAEKELLDRVAEKCGRVLHTHPDSAWADDALLLLGTTHYYQERYESAEQRLTEFLSLYPSSELLPEAEYMLASVLLERGNPVSAEKNLEALAALSPPHPLSDDALALIGRARHDRKRYAEASEAYEQALERFPRGDRRAEIRFLSAQNFEAMGDLEAAAGQYALVRSEKGASSLAFEARMRLATVDLLRGLPDDALDVLGDLERRTEGRDELDRVLLLKGSALEAGGAVEDAIATYEGISASHAKSDASAEAYYGTGLLQRDHYEQLEEASASFKKARDEAPRSDVAARATEAVRDIDRLVGFLATIAGGDAVSERPPVGAGSEVPPGIYGDETAAPEGAVDDTTRHLTFLPTLDDAATAIPDSTGVAAAVRETTGVSAVGPDSSVVVSAFVEPEGAAADTSDVNEPEDEVAVARFRVAELYLFRFDDPERARTYYASVVEHHPDSPLAPKAALALAWILETRLNDPAGARAAYELIITDYPGSEFAAASEDHLARMRGPDTD